MLDGITIRLSSSGDYKFKESESRSREEREGQELIRCELAREKDEANVALLKEWNDIQAKIDVDYQMLNKLQVKNKKSFEYEEKSSCLMEAQRLKNKSFANIQELLKSYEKSKHFVDWTQNWLKGMRRMEQKSDEKSLMNVIPDEEEVAVDAIPLATKPPSIVDWKIVKEGKISYYQIIRADGSSKRYSAFIQMLKSFDREDLETLWKLVKAKHGYTRPEEGYERVLWGDLKTMFEHHVEDAGRIVGIKRLLDDLRVTAAKLMLLVYKLLLLVFRVNAAGIKLQLLKDYNC
ncbi:hypothetical protein Tco_0704295 [Tanacetum coccineum]|uniref:Uncharacterized protein n=1 Tax=Tanacetum coccineum TaxID=301880 RepID=A0ABQ4Y194_9ASTR